MSSNSKVFVGNLSYKTSKQDLASQFSSVGGVVNANIISRGNRSMGYGFVEFENDQVAQKAISVLNHQSIDGREINVELAKPREEGEQNAERVRGRGRGGRGRGAPRGTFSPRGGAPGAGRPFRGGSGGLPRGGPLAPSIPRGRNPPRGRGSLAPRGAPIRAQRPYPFFPRGGSPFRRGSGAVRGRPRGADRGPRESSNTTLYVNNLPFKLEDNDLKDIFKEFDVISAHVVANKYNGRKKGYGFVELASEEEQKKAISLNGYVAEGRKIGVRVAFKEVKKEEAAPPKAEELKEETKKEVKKEGEN